MGLQAGWCPCILGVQNGYPDFGPAVMAGCLLAHLVFFKVSRSEIVFIAVVSGHGMAMDTIFYSLN